MAYPNPLPPYNATATTPHNPSEGGGGGGVAWRTAPARPLIIYTPRAGEPSQNGHAGMAPRMRFAHGAEKVAHRVFGREPKREPKCSRGSQTAPAACPGARPLRLLVTGPGRECSFSRSNGAQRVSQDPMDTLKVVQRLGGRQPKRPPNCSRGRHTAPAACRRPRPLAVNQIWNHFWTRIGIVFEPDLGLFLSQNWNHF